MSTEYEYLVQKKERKKAWSHLSLNEFRKGLDQAVLWWTQLLLWHVRQLFAKLVFDMSPLCFTKEEKFFDMNLPACNTESRNFTSLNFFKALNTCFIWFYNQLKLVVKISLRNSLSQTAVAFRENQSNALWFLLLAKCFPRFQLLRHHSWKTIVRFLFARVYSESS